MARLKPRLTFGSLAALGMLAVQAPLWAQTAAENVAAARALGTEGIRLAEAGNCAAAIEKLERAEALYHAPTTLARLGECQVAVGKIVQGTENLNRVVRESLPPNAPPAFVEAQGRARKVLEAALPKIGQLMVSVEPQGATPTVTVDGVQLPNALFGAPRPTDPGNHEVRASAPGYLPTVQSVVLPEGGSAQLTLTLQPDPNAAAAPAPGAGTAPPAPGVAPLPATGQAEGATFDSGTPGAKNNTAAYVLLGVGGAGLVVGSIFGLLAISKKDDLSCPSQQCPPGEQTDKLESARTLATVSTIGFGVGLAGAAVGTVLLVVGAGDGEKTARRTPDRVTTRAWVGIGSAGIAGTF